VVVSIPDLVKHVGETFFITVAAVILPEAVKFHFQFGSDEVPTIEKILVGCPSYPSTPLVLT